MDQGKKKKKKKVKQSQWMETRFIVTFMEEFYGLMFVMNRKFNKRAMEAYEG